MCIAEISKTLRPLVIQYLKNVLQNCLSQHNRSKPISWYLMQSRLPEEVAQRALAG
jgi:hypothetical protein